MSLRELAKASGIPTSSLRRLRQAGAIAPDAQGQYDLGASLQALLRHYRRREQWAFMMLRRYRIYDGEPPEERRAQPVRNGRGAPRYRQSE